MGQRAPAVMKIASLTAVKNTRKYFFINQYSGTFEIGHANVAPELNLFLYLF